MKQATFLSYPSIPSAWTSHAESLLLALYTSAASPLNGITKLRASTKPGNANRIRVFISKTSSVDYWFMETHVVL